jgi:hypothetical protein
MEYDDVEDTPPGETELEEGELSDEELDETSGGHPEFPGIQTPTTG